MLMSKNMFKEFIIDFIVLFLLLTPDLILLFQKILTILIWHPPNDFNPIIHLNS